MAPGKPVPGPPESRIRPWSIRRGTFLYLAQHASRYRGFGKHFGLQKNQSPFIPAPGVNR